MNLQRTGVLLAIVFLLSGFGLANGDHAAELPDAGTTPDSAFYGLERAVEGIGLAFTFGQEAKAQKYAELASERVAEAHEMVDQNKSDAAATATAAYEEQIGQSLSIAEAAQQADRNLSATSSVVAEATSIHLSVLSEVADRVPAQARDAILRARNRSRTGNIQALNALSRDSPGKAADMAMGAANGRTRAMGEAVQARDSDGATRAAQDVEGYQQALQEIGMRSPKAAQKIGSGMTDQVSELAETEEAAEQELPAQVSDRVRKLRSAAVNGQIDVVRSLARTDSEEAAEIWADAANASVNRVKRAAEAGEGEDANESATEFQKYAAFGQEISDLAQQVGGNQSTVQQLVAKATSHHLTVLQDVMDRVPAVARDAISRAMEQSRQGRDAAVDALENRGMPVPDGQDADQNGQQNQTNGSMQDGQGANDTNQNGQQAGQP